MKMGLKEMEQGIACGAGLGIRLSSVRFSLADREMCIAKPHLRDKTGDIYTYVQATKLNFGYIEAYYAFFYVKRL